MKKLIGFLMVAGLVIACSGMAQADWLTTPILGYGSSYDGDVIINSGLNPTVIPHNFYLDGTADDAFYNTGSPSMSTFTVGQEVHTGSGIYLTAGETFDFSAVFTDTTNSLRSHSYSGSFPSDGFWMTWNSPVAYGSGADGGGLTLTNADIGSWNYVEAYYLHGGTQALFSSTTPFTVTGVPEPGTLILLGSGLLGLVVAGRKKFRK